MPTREVVDAPNSPALLRTTLGSVGRERAATVIDQVYLSGALILAVLQLNDVLPGGSVSLYWSLFGVLLVRRGAALQQAGIVGAIVMLFVAQSLAIIWSPSWLDSIQAAATSFSFLAVYLVAIQVAADRPDAVANALVAAAPALLLQVVLTITFLAAPTIEAQYLTWGPAHLFSGSAVGQIYGDEYNNVLETDKAGGLFLSGNIASMFMGSVALIYMACAWTLRRRFLVVVGGCLIVGSVSTGSKTGLYIACLMPFILVLLGLLTRAARFGLPLLVTLSPAIATIPSLVNSVLPSTLARDSASTYEARELIWEVAKLALESHPILGLGYGGWAVFYGAHAYLIGFDVRPAHNFLLQSWLDGGVLLVLATVVFVGVVSVSLLRRLAREKKGLWLPPLVVLGAFMWVWIHGQGDNTTVLGELHTLPFLAVGLAVALQVAPTPSGAPIRSLWWQRDER